MLPGRDDDPKSLLRHGARLRNGGNVGRMTEPKRWQDEADRLANAAVRRGDPTGWFEELYAAGDAGETTMAWNRTEPMPVLQQWFEAAGRRPYGSVVVVGCGLGADAEYLAAQGLHTMGFDLSPTAIRTARQRYPDSVVDYRIADLLRLPDEWRWTFDLVVEIYTVQALPPAVRAEATAAVRDLVAPGGTLLAIEVVAPVDDDGSGPPWLLSADEVADFGTDGLQPIGIEQVADGGTRYWRAEFRRDSDR